MYMYKPPKEITNVTFYIDPEWSVEQKRAAIPEDMRGNTVVVDDTGDVYTVTAENINDGFVKMSNYGQGGMFKFETLSEDKAGVPNPETGQETKYGAWKIGVDRYRVVGDKVFQPKAIVEATVLGSESAKSAFSDLIESGKLTTAKDGTCTLETKWGPMQCKEAEGLVVCYGRNDDGTVKSSAILTLTEESAKDYIICTEAGDDLFPLTGSITYVYPTNYQHPFEVSIPNRIHSNGNNSYADNPQYSDRFVSNDVATAIEMAIKAYPGVSVEAEKKLVLVEISAPWYDMKEIREKIEEGGRAKVEAQELHVYSSCTKLTEGQKKVEAEVSIEVISQAKEILAEAKKQHKEQVAQSKGEGEKTPKPDKDNSPDKNQDAIEIED